jgi:hypothetical protein
MQNDDALAARFAPEETGPVAPADAVPVVVAETIAAGPIEPAAVPIDELTIAPALDDAPDLPAAPVLLAAAESESPVSDVMNDAKNDGGDVLAEVDCTPLVAGRVEPAALVDLSVYAPCHISTQMTVHHQGMMFSAVTDQDGAAQIMVPALTEQAVFIVEFPDEASAIAVMDVPELAQFERAVLQWRGAAGLQLHALDFGADYGQDGHIWAASAGDMDRGISGEGGFVVRLGDEQLLEPLMAEIYTFPSATNARVGQVELNAEIEITTQNCGQEISAQSLQISQDGVTESLDLVMQIPTCDAVGDFLVLKNMFEDLTLAAR